MCKKHSIGLLLSEMGRLLFRQHKHRHLPQSVHWKSLKRWSSSLLLPQVRKILKLPGKKLQRQRSGRLRLRSILPRQALRLADRRQRLPRKQHRPQQRLQRKRQKLQRKQQNRLPRQQKQQSKQLFQRLRRSLQGQKPL